MKSIQGSFTQKRNMDTAKQRSVKPRGYWAHETILKELEMVINDSGRFLTGKELLATNRGGLAEAIREHGGFKKYRRLMGYDLPRKPDGYWTYETTITELKKIIEKIGHFPTYGEIDAMDRMDLSNQITIFGGINFFRKSLGYDTIQKSHGYWTLERTLIELKAIHKGRNHLLTREELCAMNRVDLDGAIYKNGGRERLRKLLGLKPNQRPHGYWTYENTLKELEKIITQIGHFPTHVEIEQVNNRSLNQAMYKLGGTNVFREAMGFSVSAFQQYKAESASYCGNRGRKTENIVKNILINWCKQNGYPEPKYNQKLSPHNYIEFLCSHGKTIAVDVTNTKNRAGHAIRRKYRKKDYHKYVSELWVVVFSNVFSEKDYRKFNEESPDNVRVMSIDTFLEELDIATDEHLNAKIDAYKNCTFRTKDEFIHRHENRSLADFGHEGAEANRATKR